MLQVDWTADMSRVDRISGAMPYDSEVIEDGGDDRSVT